MEAGVTVNNLSVDFTLTAEAVVAVIGLVVTVVIAIIGGVYAIVSNTKKYELTECYRKELLEWYSETVGVMIDLIHHFQSGNRNAEGFGNRKTELLSRLSALTEVGRFYFPNVIDKAGFGSHKPSAYRGYRHINLEFLLHFYDVALEDGDGSCIPLLWKLEQNFTSMIFDTIDPRKRNKLYSKYTAITIPKGKSIGDFLREDPENAKVFGEYPHTNSGTMETK